MDNTEKSRRRRAKAAAAGAVRVNVELRDGAADKWRELVEERGGATQALVYLVERSEGRRTVTQEDVLAWIRRNTKG
jgi:hypothetical protein